MERLDAGEIVIGDGGFVFALEKRGYVKAGPWTPEAAAEHPEAGKSCCCGAKSKTHLKKINKNKYYYTRADAVRLALQCASCIVSS